MMALFFKDWVDLTGLIGVAMILWAYLYVQIGRISVEQIVYPIINLVGSVLIAISLLYHFNLPAFIIEIAWTLISVYGIYKCVKLRRQHE